MTRYEQTCLACRRARYHFFHDSGKENTNPRTKAFKDCDLCLTGRIHFNHNERAFNTSRVLRGDEHGCK